MTLQRTLLIFVTLFLFSFMAAGQEKYPATLLWRISGNKLSEPSYLYGTMHLQDRRLFFFGDSLYNALEKTKGFAMEINPDEMVDSLFKELNSKDTSALIKKLLDKETFKRIAGRLEKKLKTPAEKITMRQLSMEKDSWVYKIKRKDDMPVAMDMYLYNIARKQGKITGGIEDVSDQMGIYNEMGLLDIEAYANDDTAMQISFLDTMKKIYIERNLTALDQLVNGNKSSAFSDMLLVKRNIKMTSRMDSIMRLRNNFFAVGAAHLPGKTGLITLLQQAGYTVEPVFASAYPDPASYKYTIKEQPWITVEDNDHIVSVQMPGLPSEMLADSETPMKVYFDLGDMSYYGISIVPVSEEEAKADTFFTKIIRNYKKMKLDVQGVKNIEYKGEKGVEMSVTQGDNFFFRYRLLVKGSTMVIIIYGSGDKEKLSNANAVRYLSSLSFNEAAFTGLKNWQRFGNERNAFTIEFPGKMVTGTEPGADGLSADKYSMMDVKNGSYYALVVRDLKPGYYVINDSINFDEYQSNLNQSTHNGVKEFRPGLFKGYPSSFFEAVQKEGNQEFVVKGYMIRRGNRTYLSMIAAPKYNADLPEYTRFLRSLEFVPFKESGWEQQTIPGGVFSTRVPGALVEAEADSTADETAAITQRYIAADTNTGLSFVVEKQAFPQYYFTPSDTAYFRKKAADFKEWGDSVLSYTYTSQPLKSATVIIKPKGVNSFKKVKILLNGDTLYTLSVYYPEEALKNAYFNAFFDSARFITRYPVTVFNNKTPQLLSALQSTDSAAYTKARQLLPQLEFTNDDLPLLYNALVKKYPAGKNEYNTVNELIADAITDLNDTGMVQFVLNRYAMADDSSENIQMLLLQMLASQPSAASYTVLRKLMLEQTPVTGNPYDLSIALSRSAKWAKDFFPAACRLYGDTVLGAEMVMLAVELLDSGLVNKEAVLQNEKGLLALAESQWQQLNQDEAAYARNNYQLIELLRQFNTKESNSMLQRFTRVPVMWVQNNAVLALLKNNQPVAAATLLQFAEDRAYCTSFYDDLKKIGKTALFPRTFYTQEKFSESYLYNTIYDDYELEVDKMQLIKTVKARINGTEKKYFIYKVVVNEGDANVAKLAFCGPFSTNAAVAEIDVKDLDVYLDYDGVFSAGKVDMLFRKFIDEKNAAAAPLIK